jgi:hypothetical protein
MTNHSRLALAAAIMAASIIGAAAPDHAAPVSTDTPWFQSWSCNLLPALLRLA